MKIRPVLTLSCLLLAAMTPLWADIETRTTIRDTLEYGTHERAGLFSLTFDDNDLPVASPANPVYIRIQLPSGVFLADTRVWQNAANAGNPTFDPIYIPIQFEELIVGDSIVAPADTVSIVRWVQGEDQIWLCITSPTSDWIENAGMPVLPSAGRRPILTVGLNARFSWNQHSGPFGFNESNLPAASRTTAASTEADAVTTMICVDLSQASQPIQPDPGSLLSFDISFWNDMTTSGATSPAEAAGSGDIALGTALMPTVFGDQRIIRVYRTFAFLGILSPILPDIVDPGIGVINHSYDFPLRVDLGFPFTEFFSESIIRINFPPALMQGFPVATDGMNNPIDYNTIDPSVPPGTRVLVEGLAVANVAGFSQPSGPVGSLFEIEPGLWAIREAEIVYSGPTIPDPVDFDMETDMLLAAGIGLNENRFEINTFIPTFEDPTDTAPFDGGFDQWQLCQPSLVTSVNGIRAFGNAVRSVPTLGEWALIAFVTLLIGTAIWFNRRQRLALATITTRDQRNRRRL